MSARDRRGRGPQHYRIRVAEQLGPEWCEWFGGLVITNLENGEALLTGELRDQAALHGVLGRLRDLNVTLLSFEVMQEASIASHDPRR